MKSYGVLLVKILDEKYLDDFLNGKIYMNSVQYFNAIDQQDYVRFDLHEGVDECWQVQSISIHFDSKWVPIGGLKNPVVYRRPDKNKAKENILCVHAIKNHSYAYDGRNEQFGNKAVFISDAKEFIYRLKKAANKLNRDLYHGPIEYVSKMNYEGAMGSFKKFDDYSYQHEFRFLVNNGDGKACSIDLGCIRDITLVANVGEIPQVLHALNA